MYIVKLDGQTLYDPRIDLLIDEPKLDLEVNGAGQFDFKIYPSHILYDNINKLKSVIEVYQDGVLLFRGRPLTDTLDFYNIKQVHCEGDLAFFNDSIQRPYEYSGTVADYLDLLITNHNEQVETDREFTLGNITVTDANDFIIRADTSYPKTWETIKTKLIDLLGGYIVVRRVGEINYIDYLADSNYVSSQVIQLGENILDVAQSREGQDIYTALIPVGSTLQDDDNVDYKVDITSVNGGLDYIYDTDAVAQYGYIYKMVEFQDVTVPSNLLTKAQATLNQAINTLTNIEIKAIDLSMLDVSIDEFRIFEYVTVTSGIHQLDDSYLIKKLTLDLSNPKNNSITIGKTYSTFTDKQFQANNVIKEVVSDYVKNKSIQDVKTEIQSVSSSIIQTAETIRFEVESVYATKSSLDDEIKSIQENYSTITQTAEEIDLAITEVKSNITEVTTTTGFKFNADGLEISRTDEEMATILTNDGLTIFRDKDTVEEVQMLKVDNTGVDAVNLTARKYLIIGLNSRMEDYLDGTGVFSL